MVIASDVKVARSFWGRLRGLMGRATLPPGEALYLPGTNSIHMLFMRFPIDCLFLGHADADGSRPIVAVRRSLGPWRGVVWWVRGARDAVELPAGTLGEGRACVGDHVRLERSEP